MLRATFHRLCVMVGAGLLVVGSAAVLASAQKAPRDLSTVALTGKQVGPGYVRKVFAAGRQVQGQVTLDLCGADYPSERLRLDRYQAAYEKRGATLSLSNEVVRYRPGGARQALREIRAHVRKCPRTPVESGVAGVPPIKYRSWTRLTDRRLLPNSAAWSLLIEVRNGDRTVRQRVAIVYQVKGDLLSGIYVLSGSPAAQKRFALAAAAASAKNLRRA